MSWRQGEFQSSVFKFQGGKEIEKKIGQKTAKKIKKWSLLGLPTPGPRGDDYCIERPTVRVPRGLEFLELPSRPIVRPVFCASLPHRRTGGRVSADLDLFFRHSPIDVSLERRTTTPRTIRSSDRARHFFMITAATQAAPCAMSSGRIVVRSRGKV